MRQPSALDADTSTPSGELAGHLFVITFSFGITTGLVATAGMLLAGAAFATARTIVVPLVATFEGFRDSSGTNAVTVTGSWVAAALLAIVLAGLLSFVVLRHFGSSEKNQGPGRGL